jgi:F-type H+-transporting ATPase subunit delta
MKAPDRILAKRYAAAFIKVCGENPRAGVQALRKLRLGLKGVEQYLANPLVPVELKKAILSEKAAEKTGPAFSLVSVLVGVRRFYLLEAVTQEADLLCDAGEGVCDALVTSASSLDAAEAETLRRGLERLSGRKVRLSAVEDPSLIGGFKARMGDTLVDATLRGSMEKLKAELGGNNN